MKIDLEFQEGFLIQSFQILLRTLLLLDVMVRPVCVCVCVCVVHANILYIYQGCDCIVYAG